MKFVANDGKIFTDLDECKTYEDELNDRVSIREKKKKEVEDARKKYLELRDAYYEEYGDPLGDYETFAKFLVNVFN